MVPTSPNPSISFLLDAMVNLLSVHAKDRKYLEGIVQRRAVIADAERLLPSPHRRVPRSAGACAPNRRQEGWTVWGQLWLKKGRLAAGTVLAASDRAYPIAGSKSPSHCDRRQRGVPAAAAVLSASDRAAIGSEMASRRAVRSQLKADPTSRFQKFCVAAPVRIVRQVGQAAAPMGQRQARRTTSSFPGTDLGCGTRGNRARRAVKPAFSGRDLYQNIQSIGS